MAERPDIPAELRRIVLVEAGHRCAIHTCHYPDVIVHHIIPWEQCREHSYENLIALCRNCHDRADRGEIDRKALRLYKSQVAASFRIPSGPVTVPNPVPGTPPRSARQWQAETLREVRESHPMYEVELQYPAFTSGEPDLEELSIVLRSRALDHLHRFRSILLAEESLGERDEWWAKYPSALSSSFDVSCLTPFLVSVRYSFFHYGAGAAHPNHFTEVVNYQRDPLIPLKLFDLFRGADQNQALKTLSAFCIEQLAAEGGDSEPSDWVREGAGPDAKNFEKFNILPRGLLITFDEYEVGPYAAGAREVKVPATAVQPFLNQACRVVRHFGRGGPG